MKNLTFEVEENGKNKKFNIIKIVKRNDKNYIIYNEENSEEINASTYNIVNNKVILGEIETDEEWDYIDQILEGLDNNGSK